MKIVATGAILLLTFSIISFGMPNFANAQSSELPISVKTDFPGYAENSEILIFGKVRDSSLVDYPQDIAIMIVSPNGSIVTIAQVSLNSNNEYSYSFTSGGTMTEGGEYTVKAYYGPQKGETTFSFTGSSGSASLPPVVVVEEPEPVVVVEEPEPIVEEPEPIVVVEPEPEPAPLCGEGTVMKDGKCVVEQKEGGGCLIATAAFGSEMAPQVQFLREIRDNTVMSTQSGTAFMTGFNQFYYSFSPYVADYERENPVFKEAVKVTLTPLLTSLTLLNYVDVDTEEEMLGYGIGIILLNIGMYFVAPAAVIIVIKNRIKQR